MILSARQAEQNKKGPIFEVVYSEVQGSEFEKKRTRIGTRVELTQGSGSTKRRLQDGVKSPWIKKYQ